MTGPYRTAPRRLPPLPSLQRRRRDLAGHLAAFVVGAILGAGLAFWLRW